MHRDWKSAQSFSSNKGDERFLTEYSAVLRSIKHNKFLDQTLSSLNAQTIPPAEILIVLPDDVEPWAEQNPRVRFVPSKRGAVSQRCIGIISARYNRLVLLDDDVVLETTTCETMLQSMD